MEERHFSYRHFLLACRKGFRMAGLAMLIGAAMIVAALTGCAGRLAGDSYVATPLPEAAAAEAIARDAAVKIATIYPPGHTRLELVYPVDGRGHRVMDAFTAALEDGLRRRGFTISPDAALRLAWTLDSLTEEKEEPADPLLKTKREDKSGQVMRHGKNDSASQAAGQGVIDASQANTETTWYLRLKLADTDKFEARSLTRVYDAFGLTVAGWAESQN